MNSELERRGLGVLVADDVFFALVQFVDDNNMLVKDMAAAQGVMDMLADDAERGAGSHTPSTSDLCESRTLGCDRWREGRNTSRSKPSWRILESQPSKPDNAS